MLFLLCLLPLGASAQSIVKGIVKDSSGEPIIGATIKVNGSKVGAVRADASKCVRLQKF